ncbi:MAG TPA: hypothetical protein VN372_15525 [Methanospirillum sp.]|nr:hypothetical protein [Methanospirillum sp.]
MLILLTLLFLPTFADVPVEGMKQYNYQYVINNTADYPDYFFLTSSEIWKWNDPKPVLNGTFQDGYKFDGFVLHAIKQTDMDPGILSALMDPMEAPEKNLTEYFEKVSIATANVSLPVSTTVDDTIPLIDIQVNLHVNSISPTDLNVSMSSVIFRYTDTRSEEIPLAEGEDVPEPGVHTP